MKIDVRGLAGSSGEQRHYDLSVDLGPLRSSGQDVRLEPVQVRLVLTATPGGVLAVGDLKAQAELVCSRCLGCFRQEVADTFEHLFVLSTESQPPAAHGKYVARAGETAADGDDDDADQEDGIDTSPIIDGEIDLRPLLTEVLDVAMPMKPVCRADCPGLCPVCGHPLSEGPCACKTDDVDPRLAGLGRLVARGAGDQPLGGSEKKETDRNGSS